MIKFENYDIWGFEHALRGMRNPLESWERNDSGLAENCNIWEGDDVWFTSAFNYKIGPYDLALAQRLIQAGPEHRKFLRQIMVSVDITAPLYWWKEFDTYKVGTVANSSSTMHMIHTRPITLDDFSHEHLGYFDPDLDWDDQPYEDMTITVPVGNLDAEQLSEGSYPIDILKDVIGSMNKCRELYLQTKDRKYWWQIIQLLPSSYNQRRTVTLNYENLRSMYFQRRNHKLDEWRIGFCGWVEDLPYSEELIMFDPKEDEDGAS